MVEAIVRLCAPESTPLRGLTLPPSRHPPAADGHSVDRGLLPSSSQSSIYSQTPLSTPSVTPTRTPVHSRRGSAQGGYAYLPPGSAGSTTSGRSRATRAHRVPPLDRATTESGGDSPAAGESTASSSFMTPGSRPMPLPACPSPLTAAHRLRRLTGSGHAVPDGSDRHGPRSASKATRSHERLLREYKHEVERLQRENREVWGRRCRAPGFCGWLLTCLATSPRSAAEVQWRSGAIGR